MRSLTGCAPILRDAAASLTGSAKNIRLARSKQGRPKPSLKSISRSMPPCRRRKPNARRRPPRSRQARRRHAELQGLLKTASDFEALQSQPAQMRGKYTEAAAKAEKLRSEYACKYRMFLDAQAGVLAATLSDGQPCPVCGSTEHPSLATPADGAPTEAELESAKLAAERAGEGRAGCERRRRQAFRSSGGERPRSLPRFAGHCLAWCRTARKSRQNSRFPNASF